MAKLIGNSNVRETYESGRHNVGKTTTLEIVKRGLKAALEGAVPPYGSKTFLGGYVVVAANLIPQRGGMAELRVTVTPASSDVPGGADGAISDRIETEMAMIERPILNHPDCTSYVEEIELWRSEPTPLIRSNFAYTVNETRKKKLQDGAIKIAELILKGVESWLDFAPVVTRTALYNSRPHPANIGCIMAPPILFPGWEFLKTCDKAAMTDDDHWQRTEQWTGATTWSRLLYKEA